MKTIIPLVFIVVGVMLIIFGVSAADSVSSSFSRLFTGSPTDKSIWLLIGGAACVVIGLFGTFRYSLSR